MAIKSCTPSMFKNIFITGANKLESKKNYVDELNVFPVPDGDTGTNMTLTITSAVKELKSVNENNKKEVLSAISSGSLRGARGNSGVILSQIFRGLCKSLSESEEIDVESFAVALNKSTKTAYKAVMKPKEGTILTVIKNISEQVNNIVFDFDNAQYNEESDIETIEQLFKLIVDIGNASLENTPNLLPVLKQAGVVDSGGQGLMYIFTGMHDCIKNGGDIVTYDIEEFEKIHSAANSVETEDITFGYCTEFIVNTNEEMNTEEESIKLRDYLFTIGDSIVAVADTGLIKIHVHTDNPGQALQKALELGDLTNIKIDNMREEHRHRLVSNEEVAISKAEEAKTEETNSVQEQQAEETVKKEVGFVVISVGDGLKEIFKGLGVDYVVEGGQTMNPSTEDLINAISKVNADNVFIMPNNKNIILAANQAKEIIKDKNVIVVETKTVTEGISALIEFNENVSPEENGQAMTQALEYVTTGQITYAIRDTVIDEHEIKEGDVLGLIDGHIAKVNKDVDEVLIELVENMIKEDTELISLYYGEDVEEESAQTVVELLEEKYPDVEFDLNYGGQPLYYYFISAE